jgi:hypothetical protein
MFDELERGIHKGVNEKGGKGVKLALSAMLVLGFSAILWAGVEDQVQYIRDIYQQVNDEIDAGDLYRTVVDVNIDGKSYPAVGIYHPVLTFYFGFSEEEPYPDNLMKAHLVVDRSAYHEYTEFLYNGYGALIFVYVTGRPDMPETRFYYDQGQLIKLVDDSGSYTSFDADQLTNAATFMYQGEQMVNTFTRLFY